MDQKLQFTYPEASIKNVQVTEEAFSSQNRPYNTTKSELLKKILLLWVIFALLDPDPQPPAQGHVQGSRGGQRRILAQTTLSQHCA